MNDYCDECGGECDGVHSLQIPKIIRVRTLSDDEDYCDECGGECDGVH